jgi:hypothetical protein
MKRNILLFGCIISCLILVSLSSQPIIAEKPIIKSKEERISVENLDCGCESNNNPWIPHMFCLYLAIKWWSIKILEIIFRYDLNQWLRDYIEFKLNKTLELYNELNCKDSFIWDIIFP